MYLSFNYLKNRFNKCNVGSIECNFYKTCINKSSLTKNVKLIIMLTDLRTLFIEHNTSFIEDFPQCPMGEMQLGLRLRLRRRHVCILKSHDPLSQP